MQHPQHLGKLRGMLTPVGHLYILRMGPDLVSSRSGFGSWRVVWSRMGVLVLVLCGGLTVCAPVSADELVRTKQVRDGDTILLEDGRPVRYLGINAPEFQEPFYLKAKRLNDSLVKDQQIRLEFDQEKSDHYNRLLAYVYVGDEMVNARLVQEGLAHAFFIGPSRKYNSLLLRLQAEAKQRKLGIWSARARVRDLKITSVHPVDPNRPDPDAPYVRVTNLSDITMPLAGYVLSNEGGQRYVFPNVSLDPGYTVIVTGRRGTDGLDDSGQMIVHWPTQGQVWDPREDTAFLTDPTGTPLDMFHYKGRRITRPSSRSRSKTPKAVQ